MRRAQPMPDDLLLDTQQAFDSVAADYDGPSGNNALIQRLRARTMAAVIKHIPAGSSILDLGCGTGLDAAFLAQQGYRVTAIDWSPEMIHRAQARIAELGLQDKVDVRHLGIQELDQLPKGAFAGAYSDLGPLNCVPDLHAAARLIADALRPGGKLVLSVIGRVCPWEWIVFGMKGQWSRARVRFSKTPVPVPLNGQTVWTAYYSPREFSAAFAAAGFEILSLRALSLLVPPPYMIAFAERRPRLIEFLQRVEDRVAGWPLLREWGDHFLIVLQKSPDD
jgi:SAM-dependent methyltransferase